MADSQKKPKSNWRYVKWLVNTLLIVAVGLAIFRQQDIFDWWRLRDYQAPAAISTLAEQTTMTAKARRLFYINRPQLQDKATFYVSCDENESTIVLGCFKPPHGIYLLAVDDKRLDGVEQVTAAHELLHAAYARLGPKQKEDIGKKLQDYYKTLDNISLREKIAVYLKSDADVNDELHSILGTEVAELSPELEEYYERYFTKRSQLATYAAQYQAVFTERKLKLKQYDDQLAQIETQIQAKNQELDRQQRTISAESAKLDSLLQQQKYVEYNQGVIAYNALLPPYRALAAETRALVESYKTTLAARNQVAIEAQELNKALDSRIQEPSQKDI